MQYEDDVIAGSSGEQIRGRRVISVVGINQYEHMPTLRNAVPDAKGIRDVFVGELGFEEPVPHLFDEAATKEAIEELIEDRLRDELGRDDELILFFAGHGCARDGLAGGVGQSTGFIAPVDTRLEQWRTQIKIKNLLDSVNSLDIRYILVILDACSAGLAADELMWRGQIDASKHQELGRKLGRKLLISARKHQVARDDGPVPNHSLFTGTLIRGLREHEMDLGGKGLITSAELALYVEQRVAQATHDAQIPDFGSFGNDGGGELILSLCSAAESPREAPSLIVGSRRGRRIISVIGIDGYKQLPRLRNAVADAKGIRDLFVNELEFEEPILPLFDEDATKDALEELVEDRLRRELGPHDDLILFFAGHAYTREHRIGENEKTTGFIAPADAVPGRWTRQIKIRSWLDSIDDLPARNVFVVLDACHSGPVTGDLMWTSRAGEAKNRESLSTKIGRKILVSARHDQLARDNGPVAGCSLFAGMLIRSLRTTESDWGGDELVTTRELGLYVEQRVGQATASGQTPAYGCFGSDRGGELFIPVGNARGRR